MKVNDFKSHSYPEMNARILQTIERLTYNYSSNLLDGWRCCVELQGYNDDAPYYLLDVESNRGGGRFAPIKMGMLRQLPELPATGRAQKNDLITTLDGILNKEIDPDRIEMAKYLVRHLREELHDINWIDNALWGELEDFNLTRWYGGIRIPYDVLVTRDVNGQVVDQLQGEIRITFSGAKEWQDVFYAFRIFQEIQIIIDNVWETFHFRYNLNLLNGPVLEFWRSVLQVQPVPEDNKIIIK